MIVNSKPEKLAAELSAGQGGKAEAHFTPNAEAHDGHGAEQQRDDDSAVVPGEGCGTPAPDPAVRQHPKDRCAARSQDDGGSVVHEPRQRRPAGKLQAHVDLLQVH